MKNPRGRVEKVPPQPQNMPNFNNCFTCREGTENGSDSGHFSVQNVSLCTDVQLEASYCCEISPGTLEVVISLSGGLCAQ
jgi:hypothetical protein